MSAIEAFFLGTIQGLTEYLPVSSSGHLQFFHSIFGTQVEENLMFDVLLHVATCCSTLCVYHKHIGTLFLKTFGDMHWNESKKYVLSLFISCLPVLFIGVFFLHTVETIYEGNLILLGSCFILTAVCLFWGKHINSITSATGIKQQVSFKNAFIIGLAQALAVLPGLSRSGLTISTGMMCKIDKKVVTEFSFLMVLIPVFGKVFLDIIDMISGKEQVVTIDLLPALIGFFTAFMVGYFACLWMIKLIQNKNLSFFAYYCATLGIVILVYGFCKG